MDIIVVYEIIGRMESILSLDQLKVLESVLMLYDNTSKNTKPMYVDTDWQYDLQDFLTSKFLGGLSEKTIERYQYELHRMPSYINKSVDKITSEDISMYLKIYKRLREVSLTTLKNVRAVYSSFFNWLRDHDKIHTNPCSKVERIKVPYKIHSAYSEEEKERLFRNCKCIRDRALTETLYSTAMRVSELVSVDIDDINWTDKSIVIVGKGGKQREVFLNDRSLMYIQEYLSTRDDSDPALFVTLRNPHKRMTICTVEAVMNKLGKAANVKNCHPHRWRRTSIINALNKGMPLQEASIIAGHASTDTTLLYWNYNKNLLKLHHSQYLGS